uniref:Reverse transcriptase domain-containing protein n=1 Tax=Anolis carolinensis TaxID=28377 RepID=A0A803T8M6_ANOCA
MREIQQKRREHKEMSKVCYQLKCFSNNLNGLNSPNKRNRLFNKLKKEKYNIIAIQETHIALKHISLLKKGYLGQSFIAADKVKKRGVVLYIDDKFPAKEVFKDNEGRVIAVTIDFENEKILICNIYAPNGPKTKFIKTLREKINNTEFDHMILLGDFNGVLDVKLDKTNSSKKVRETTSLPKNLIVLKEEYDLIDPWRELNPTSKDYTHFSNRHQAWSRIDMIWTSKSLMTTISDIQIRARDISDHCPLTMVINKKHCLKKWRLNENLLKHKQDVNKINAMIVEYFSINDNGETNPQIVWDAFKAVARGFFIQLNSSKRKHKDLEWNRLNKEIEAKEKELKINPKNQKIKRNLALLAKMKERWDLEEVAKKIKWVKQYAFENANKPGKWLARLIRKKKQNRQIMKIKFEERMVNSDKEIREAFQKFYVNLYSKDNINPEAITEYLGKQKLDKITDEQRLDLNKEITEEEILKAIKSLDSNKTPGPDGFIAGFYKLGQPEMIKFLKKLMNQALQDKVIPETWKEATIIMIPKEDADPSETKNYRPISLLNTDYKIFTKILANRLKKFLNGWIGEDQTGFLPSRTIKDNVRVILDAMEFYEQHNQREVGFLSVDAEKAFDNLNWNFFKLLFQELDLGTQIQNGINSIYEDQWAKIQINGQETDKIVISKGTRQGCPLSPLIFIMALEILLKAIKKDINLQGIKIDNQDYKYRAFADDVICIIENPIQNIHKWIAKIDEFGKVAGLKINKKKTMMLTKNMSKRKQKELQDIAGLETPLKLKYLGIWISAKNNQLLDLNYIRIWKEIKNDLEKWKNINVSLLGRIAIIKMNILPKLLYLFQNIPIIRSTKLFKDWQKEIMRFIWKNKRARINYNIMISRKTQGGLGVPDLKLYHDACALCWIRDWAKLEKVRILNLEGHELRKGWHGYMWYKKAKIEKQFGNHFIRSALLRVWDNYKSRFHTKTPLWLSPIEADHRRLLGWRKWPTYRELLTVANDKRIPPKLKELTKIQELNKNVSWYQYFQIKEAYKGDSLVGFEQEPGFWDKFISIDKKCITVMYNNLLSWDTESSRVTKAMTTWAKNIERPIQMQEWESIWNKKMKYTYSVDLKENWLKLIHRWYLTPKKIGLMYKNANNKCWRCKTQTGSYFHMWWKCKKLGKFWTAILEESNVILKTKFIKKPELLLLGLYNCDDKIDPNTDKLFTFFITAARLVIARLWKSTQIPTKELWLDKLLEIKNMDQLSFLIKKTNGTILKATDWTSFEDYLKNIVHITKD